MMTEGCASEISASDQRLDAKPRHDEARPVASPQSTRRIALGLASTVAFVVAVVFLTIGDGVDAPADGWRSVLVEWGHACVWLLLAAGLAIGALRDRWTGLASMLCGLAGAVYLAFLIALLTS